MTDTFYSYSKEKRFLDFANCVQFCNLCPRMHHRNRVLSKFNGNVNTEILFIAEAPGRLGADKTGVPLYGDKTGDNFQYFLNSIGWNRNQIFITNALLCNPRNEEGNNDTPNSLEIKNCSIFLEMTINLIKPKVIVTLGRKALDALNFIYPHNCNLSSDFATPMNWKEFILFPLYHPGPRALIHRSLKLQVEDYLKLSKLIYLQPNNDYENEFLLDSQKEIRFNEIDYFKVTFLYLVKQFQSLSFFKATKLLYFIDLLAIENFGRSITGSLYLRQVEGPWNPALKGLTSQLKDSISLIYENQKPILICKDINIDFNSLLGKYKDHIDNVLEKYGLLSDRGIKIAAYRSKPMVFVLQQEKNGIVMRNKAVINKNKTILELNQL